MSDNQVHCYQLKNPFEKRGLIDRFRGAVTAFGNSYGQGNNTCGLTDALSFLIDKGMAVGRQSLSLLEGNGSIADQFKDFLQNSEEYRDLVQYLEKGLEAHANSGKPLVFEGDTQNKQDLRSQLKGDFNRLTTQPELVYTNGFHIKDNSSVKHVTEYKNMAAVDNDIHNALAMIWHTKGIGQTARDADTFGVDYFGLGTGHAEYLGLMSPFRLPTQTVREVIKHTDGGVTLTCFTLVFNEEGNEKGAQPVSQLMVNEHTVHAASITINGE